jgi:hypothetical protein
MRITWLLFLTMGCAGLMPGTGYAASSQQSSADSSTNESSPNVASDHPHDAEHASHENRPRKPASVIAPNRPTQLPNSQKRSAPLSAPNLHEPGPEKSGGAPKGRLSQNETPSNSSPVRPPSVVRPTVASLKPPPDNLHHHGPAPPVVGGSANPASRSVGTINGTSMHRRP